MQRGTIGPGELKAAEITELPDGRIRLTRWRAISAGRKAATAMFLDWGTADSAAAAGVAGGTDKTVRLINQMIGDLEGEPVLIQIYEEIPKDTEIQVGNNTEIELEDGRRALEAEFLQFSTGAYVPGDVGTTTAPGDGAAFLQRGEQTNDGTLRRIKRTYVYEGIIATDDQSLQGGKLLKKTIVAVKTVPATPSGFTLVGSPVQNPLGLPSYTYTFYKGLGEISRRTEYNQSGDAGVTGVTVVTITHLTAPSAGDPTAAPGSGFVKVSFTPTEQDGYRVWTVAYANGTGLVSQLIGGGRNDGLREVTNISLGTRIAPTGAVTRDDYRIADGYIVYTVTAMQSASGAVPTDATFTLPTTEAWQYPGRAQPYTRVAENGQKILDVFLSPPVNTRIDGLMTITYQTSSDLGALVHARWQPLEWATIEAEWITSFNTPRFRVQALPEYRTMSNATISVSVDVWEDTTDGGTIFGDPIFGGTTAVLKVLGGPANPSGNTYTFDARLELAFTATNGTKYFRKIVVTAAIPNQPDLPSLS